MCFLQRPPYFRGRWFFIILRFNKNLRCQTNKNRDIKALRVEMALLGQNLDCPDQIGTGVNPAPLSLIY